MEEPRLGRGDPRGGPRLCAATVGATVHRALGRALGGPLSRRAITRAVDAELQAAGTRSPALRARVTWLCVVYVECFLPGAPARLLGREVGGRGTRLDVVWQREELVFCDEVKTAGAGRGDQLVRQLAAGRELFGSRFVGMRLLPLHAPRQACFVPAAADVV